MGGPTRQPGRSPRAAQPGHAPVHAAVREIPCGRVSTYGRIARMIGRPRAARQVGYALHNCPADVPWHRVVNAQGRLSLAADSTAGLAQRRRLEAEGILFQGTRIDLDRYVWPDHSG